MNNLTNHFREQLDVNQAQLAADFQAQQPIRDIVRAHSAAIDAILTTIWQHYFPLDGGDIAFIATGGYGRAELLPKSDIDIMILLPTEEILQQQQDTIGQFITELWDLKLDIGHSVRTCLDCQREASEDVTVITNLMEARILAGSIVLFQKMQHMIAESQIWSKEDFFNAKLAEQNRRYAKFGETAYRLEPNIKESPGGLRDMQTIFWVAKRYFNATRLEDLAALGFLTQGELNDLLNCRDLLWRIRFALHTLAKRREDRLLFEYQRELAELFGYQDKDHNLAVEQFMQQYYRAVTELQRLNEMLLQLLQEAIQKQQKPAVVEIIDDHFQAENQYLQLRHDNLFIEYPPALLEVFLVMQRHPELKGVGAKTIRAIRNHRYLIDPNFRTNPLVKELFMAILKEPHGVSHELRRMNRYGILAAYLPEFENIVGRMQYDLFHIYTVDLHTLYVIRNLRRFSVPEHASWQPTCSHIFPTLDYPEILYIAALFHDIAKGRGGDHSELGAADVARFCEQHGISRNNNQLAQWLVKNHLLMSMTAQRKDISDPDVIHEFATKVGDQSTLDYLYLLTVADITATNPDLLSSWRSRLLLELYLRAKQVFRYGLKPIDAAERVRERQALAAELLDNMQIQAKAYKTIWQEFPQDYFLRHVPEEIAWHTRAINSVKEKDLPLVLLNPEVLRGATPIFLYAKDNDGFFRVATCIMAQLNLNIVDARIITTSKGHTLDTYLVLDENNKAITNTDHMLKIHDRLTQGIRNPAELPKTSARPLSRKLQQFDTPTQINIKNSDSEQYTLLEIITGDRPGLLAQIGLAFTNCHIRVHNAKITTIGETAENIFHISDTHNQQLNEALQNQLAAELQRQINNI